MTSFFRRMLMLACLVSLLSAAGCREEDLPPSTDPDQNTRGAGNQNGDGS